MQKTKLLISFEKQNVRLASGQWLFKRRESMRFTWLALMAYKRRTLPGDQAWVSLEEIARLPNWVGRPMKHIRTNVGRYLESAELGRSQLVDAQTIWTGPYRLSAAALSVTFDLPLFEVRKWLRVRPRPASPTKREDLIRFTLSYTRAQWLYFHGLLLTPPPPSQSKNLTKSRNEKERQQDYALKRLKGMVEDRFYGTTLRLLACLTAVDILFRVGQFRAARKPLLDYRHLLRHTPDYALKARYYTKLAWAYQRAETGRRSDRAVEAAIRSASFYAENGDDRDSLGWLAHRTGGYLTKKRDFLEAVNQYILAIESFLITGNYDMVQATCGNLGSSMHRLGQKYYPEVRKWLLLSLTIARRMRLGRDDAHAEMILAKIYLEDGIRFKSDWLLKRAERIAERAGNRVNLADILMVRGLWYKRFGKRDQQIESLTRALCLFRSMPEFDVPQKERYMEHKCPEIWAEVLDRAGSQPNRRGATHKTRASSR